MFALWKRLFSTLIFPIILRLHKLTRSEFELDMTIPLSATVIISAPAATVPKTNGDFQIQRYVPCKQKSSTQACILLDMSLVYKPLILKLDNWRNILPDRFVNVSFIVVFPILLDILLL